MGMEMNGRSERGCGIFVIIIYQTKQCKRHTHTHIILEILNRQTCGLHYTTGKGGSLTTSKTHPLRPQLN
jgi:hypothetical protein